MKKLSVLLIAVLMSACMLVGCGGNGEQNSENAGNQGTTNNETNNKENNSYVFKLKGVDVQINAAWADIYAKLGKEDAYFESNSCAFQGLDKVYTYCSVVIQTYPMNEVDYVYSIELKDDTVETPEGIYIGASKADVENAYGTPATQTEIAYMYNQGESQLQIIFEGDSVKNIVYISISE